MLKRGQVRVLFGTVVDQNEDGTLEIQIPGELPEDKSTIDGIGYVTAPAARGGYHAGQTVLVLHYQEQVSPRAKYLVLGTMERENHDADAGSDDTVLPAPGGLAAIILTDNQKAGTKSIKVGRAAELGAARTTDATVADAATDGKLVAWFAAVHAAIDGLTVNALTAAMVAAGYPPGTPPTQVAGQITGGSATVAVED
jgi:hypothetical protein